MKAERASASLRRGPTRFLMLFQVPRKRTSQGFSEDSEDPCFVLFCFPTRCYSCFPAERLVQSCTKHLWAVTVTTQVFLPHPESMLTFFFFENCHVITAWSRLEAAPGKQCFPPVSFPSRLAIILDCVFHKVDLAQGQKVLFCARRIIRSSQD